MNKNRLELFSDGVFAIVLTLLVLNLKVPASHGLAALRDIAPALVVHAATFFLVGVMWVGHHGALARVDKISQRALLFNLLILFWVTLLPFAAEKPPTGRSSRLAQACSPSAAAPSSCLTSASGSACIRRSTTFPKCETGSGFASPWRLRW